jgi:carboxyl-terminal processing protease
VYTLTKEGEKTEIKGSDGHSFNKPLVVLVNGNSASASEIFAGGIKDYGTGIIVGTTTYGKGIVQRFITLGSGAAIKLTVSEYYLPSGVCIHKTGIKPDVEIDVPENLKSEVIDMEDDNQLQKAIEILNK